MSDAANVTGSDSYIDGELVSRLKSIEEDFGADVITCIHPILPPFDDIIREKVDDLSGKRDNRY